MLKKNIHQSVLFTSRTLFSNLIAIAVARKCLLNISSPLRRLESGVFEKKVLERGSTWFSFARDRARATTRVDRNDVSLLIDLSPSTSAREREPLRTSSKLGLGLMEIQLSLERFSFHCHRDRQTYELRV